MNKPSFYKLKRINENTYEVTCKKKFVSDIVLAFNDVVSAYNFGSSMITKGEHRAKRSGGQISRDKKEIFTNTFEGKLAEIGFYRYCTDHGLKMSEPDFSVSELGVWDSFDFNFKDKYIAVKSTAKYSQLLLLETKDWNNLGQYIPNLNSHRIADYDYIFLCRVNPVVKDVIRESKTPSDIYSTAYQIEITGYITQEDLRLVINNNYILKQNSYLNTTKMDAENYYIQAYDLRKPKDFINELLEYNT